MKDIRIQFWLKHYGEDVEVYFYVQSSACQRCIKQYLTNGIGSEPVLFKLIDVIKNEINAGGSMEDLYPSGVHNLCCYRTLTVKPTNSIWNTEKNKYVLVRNTYGVNRKSKIVVTIKKTQ